MFSGLLRPLWGSGLFSARLHEYKAFRNLIKGIRNKTFIGKGDGGVGWRKILFLGLHGTLGNPPFMSWWGSPSPGTLCVPGICAAEFFGTQGDRLWVLATELEI